MHAQKELVCKNSERLNHISTWLESISTLKKPITPIPWNWLGNSHQFLLYVLVLCLFFILYKHQLNIDLPIHHLSIRCILVLHYSNFLLILPMYTYSLATKAEVGSNYVAAQLSASHTSVLYIFSPNHLFSQTPLGACQSP
jgi:hypothetical protein